MAIDIKFDLTGNPEPPTILLANRSGNILGQLDVETESIDMSDKFNDASEFSFTLYKYLDNKITNLWDKVVDFKLVYCKEWNEWFEIKVELDEATETVKTVFCTQLEKAELSQLNLYNIEINTEDDIKRDDYKICILYDENDADASILNRLLKDKAPHYSIAHVDSTIKKIQRSFSFDGTSIDDAFQEIAEEIGCVFIYHSYKDEDGILRRTISVYDLQQNCNACGHRGEFTDKCPKCNSTDITEGYGEDTLIFVTSDELATDGIELVTDVDSVKNCFKLEAGDDLMTATIRNCNPNGTDYLWYFSDAMKEDMSKELVDRLKSYDELYKDYCDNYESKLDESLVDKYNELVEKYKVFYNTKSTCLNCDHKEVFEGNCPKCGSSSVLSGKSLQSIPKTINGYSSLMNVYYNTIDLALYLESALMPNVEMSETNAKEQADLLTASSLSPVAVNTEYVESISPATADSAILSMAKIIVKSTYKVEVKTSTLSEDKIWEGSFIITNYSDENDTAESQTIKVTVNNDTETFVKQKLEKALNKEDTDDYSISGLFEKEYDDFCVEIKKYALNPLKSFYDACDTCLNILIDQGAGNKDEKSDLYEGLYLPYYNKSDAIAKEILLRENEIAVIKGVYDETDEENKVLKTDGLQTNIEKCQTEIKNALNFQEYLGEKLWLEFCAYRREDTYSNDNYISDGLNNAELFKKSLEFIEVAENEIYKSAELQHSISTTLNNLLAIPKFKSLVKHFKVGNWIRVQVDEKIFKLRLLEYEISYGDFDNIPVEFSDVTKVKNGVTDVKSVIEQASSMATSYDAIQRQAKQGDNAKDTVDQWFENGLSSALVRIKSNNNEEVTMGKNGLMCRSYDDIADTYSPEQFRLTHNIMAYTSDNWNTVSTALGKHDYVYYDADKVSKTDTDYGLSAKFVTAGYINGSQIIGGEIYSQNYTDTTGTYIDLNYGDFSWAGGKIKYDSKKDILDLTGKITATSGEIGGFTIGDTYLANGTSSLAGASNSVYLGTNGISCGKDFKVTSAGKVTASGVDLTGKITASSGKIAGWDISGSSLIREYTSNNITRSVFMQGYGTDTNNAFAVRHKASSDTSWTYDFYVRNDGYLKATNADITGKITASSGSITGNLSVSGSLTHTRGNYTVTLRAVPTTVTNGVFYITDKSSGKNVYPFIVNGDGSFRATKATISGDSTFGGTLNAVSGSFVKLTAGASSFEKEVVIIDAAGASSVRIGTPDYTDDSGKVWKHITIRPNIRAGADPVGNIGTPNHLWDLIYSKAGSISSSDRNKKRDILSMGEIQEQLFNELNPVTYKFSDGSSHRTHYGFVSQDVEEAMLKTGLNGEDFAGFCKDSYLDDDGNKIDTYGLRYTEFIALNTHMIQKLQTENNRLKERIDLLESKLEQLL